MDEGNIFEIDLFAYVPTVVVVAGAVLIGVAVRVVLNRTRKGKPGLAFTKQLVTFSLVLAGIVAVLIALPIRDTLRGQLFTLFGIIISALIALSSSTFVGNAMAGLMLRAVRNFRFGDFIKTEGYFGRVSDRGLFHTEIQTIHRDLVTLPNMFLVNNPVTVTRSSGVFIFGDVSLGYNVSREKVEKVLIEAAENAGLEEQVEGE